MSQNGDIPPNPEDLFWILIELGYDIEHLAGLTPLQLLDIWGTVEDEVRDTEAVTLQDILNSLEAMGMDIDSQYERIQSIINVFIGTDSWDAEIAEALMMAMADGMITDAEVEAIFGIKDVEDKIKDGNDEAEDEAEDKTGGSGSGSGEVRLQWGSIGMGINLTPLYDIFTQLSLDVGGRLENWIANAAGIEKED